MTPDGRRTVARAVARAVAGAFLAEGPWRPSALRRRARGVLSAEPPWLAAAAVAAVTSWPVPPRDAAGELAEFLLGVPGVFDDDADADDDAGGRAALRVLRWLPVVPAMGPARWPVAPLHDVADVAALLGTDVGHLEWWADLQGRQRREPSGHLQLYRRRWLARPHRTPRLLEVPTPRLRTAQRTLLERVLAPVPAHPAAHGFVPGRSALTGARQHVGADVVLTMDLTSFFAAVGAGRVYRVLRTAGYPEPVARLLAGLCTTAATRDDLATMGPGGTREDRARLRRALAAPHLPQGSPTSAHLANLCASRLDRRLAGWAARSGAVYTRYADDLTFSGGPAVARRVGALQAGVQRIVADEGFAVNPAKTRVRGRGARQLVTGLVVNDRLAVPRDEVDRLRAQLTNAVRRGPSARDLAEHDGDAAALRAHLAGRVAWVAQVHPTRGRRLAALWAAVTWPEP